LQLLTLTSSHDCICFTPSPTSLNASFDSSSKSCTRSRTRSVSRLVPNNAISFWSREILPVKENSLVIRPWERRENSGSSWYCGSSCRRVVVGWDSSDDNWSNDMFAVTVETDCEVVEGWLLYHYCGCLRSLISWAQVTLTLAGASVRLGISSRFILGRDESQQTDKSADTTTMIWQCDLTDLDTLFLISVH